MTDKIFQIGVFHDEVRTDDEGIIIRKAKEKMSLKYGYDFNQVNDDYFEVERIAEKSVNLVTLTIKGDGQLCSKLSIINDLCKIYMSYKLKQKN